MNISYKFKRFILSLLLLIFMGYFIMKSKLEQPVYSNTCIQLSDSDSTESNPDSPTNPDSPNDSNDSINYPESQHVIEDGPNKGPIEI